MATPVVIPTGNPTIILREITTEEDDTALHYAVIENPEYSNSYGNTLYDCYDTLEKTTRRRLANQDEIRMGIWLGEELVGLVTAIHDKFNSQTEIGYFIRQKYSGRGYATQAVKALSDYVAPHFPRVYAEVRKDHLASARVLKKAGYEEVAQAERKWGSARIFELKR